MKLKPGVSIRGVTPEMTLGLQIISSTLLANGLECVITSCVDGKHSAGSLHYVGQAVDIRSRDAPRGKQVRVTKDLKEALGAEFDVVLESTHWHVEFQPKGPVV